MIKVGAGIIGMGFVGEIHVDALNRIPFTEVIGVYDIDHNFAKNKANKLGISRVYESMEEMLADPDVHVIHNCSPNYAHAEINEKIINAQKHVFSEKPLAMFSSENEKLLKLLKENNEIVAGVNFQNRMNPLVREMRSKVMKGEIGRPIAVTGSFKHNICLLETDYFWSYERDKNGPSFVMANTGSHWIDTAQTILDDRIIEVCADLITAYEFRKKATAPLDQYNYEESIKKAKFELKKIDLEDAGSVLFRTEKGVKGSFYISMISAGRKNNLDFEIDGTKKSLYWNLENSDRLWIGNRNSCNQETFRNSLLMDEENRSFSTLPPGHLEGWYDTVKNNIKSFYQFILEYRKLGVDRPDFATFEDAHYNMKVVEAILESNSKERWIKIS